MAEETKIGSDKWVAVDPEYAKQHPEAVQAETAPSGETYYYRPAMSATEVEEAESGGLSTEQMYQQKAREISEELQTQQAHPSESVTNDLGSTSSGDKITGVAPNVGWVITEKGETVYDIKAYADIMGHAPSYYVGGESPEAESLARERGFEVYQGEKGKDIEYPSDFSNWDNAKQVEFLEQHGAIPKGSEPIAGSGYITQKIAEALKSQSPKLYDVLKTQGYDAYAKAYTELRDKQAQEFEANLEKESPELYEAYKSGGLEALNTTREKLNAEYQAFQEKVASGEIVKLPDGKYITKDDLDKQPEGLRNILTSGGFAALEKLGTISVDEANQVMQGSKLVGLTSQDIVTAMAASGIQFPERESSAMLYPEIGYLPPTMKEAKQVWDSLSEEEKSRVIANYRDSTRDVIGVMTFIAPAAKVLLPEYTAKDVSGVEWGLSAVNVALLGAGAIPGVAGKVVGLGLMGAGAGFQTFETTRSWQKLSPLERIMGIGGATLYAAPGLFLAKDAVIYGVRKPIDILTKTFNPESIRLRKGMPYTEVKPGVTEARAVDVTRVGQVAAQEVKVDILVVDPKGNYVNRVNPLQRAANILDTADTYEFTSHGSDKLFADAINRASPDVTPSYKVNVPRVGAYKEQVSTVEFASENAWIERGGQTGEGLVLEGHIVGKVKGYDPYPSEVQQLIDVGDAKGAQKLLMAMNEQGLLAGKRFPAFRMLEGGGSPPFVEPESIYGAGTEKFLVGKSYVRSPQDMFSRLQVKPELGNVKPANWDKLGNLEREAWYKKNGALSPDKSSTIERMKPEDWADMSPQAQDRWLYDNGGAIKQLSKGERIPIYWTSTDPTAKPPNFITRLVTETVTEPYTRLKRVLTMFDPNKTRVTTSYGETSRLPGLQAIEAKAKNEGQVHVGTYPNEYANVKVIGAKADGRGQVIFGDQHGKYGGLQESTNWAFDKDVVAGGEGNLRLNVGKDDAVHIISTGDVSDRGKNTLKLWNDLLNMEDDGARSGGNNKVDLVLGNHDLAHITGQKIPGIDYSNPKYEARLSKLLKDNVLSGKIKAATLTDDGGVATHAGLSLEQFPEYVGKSPDFIVNDLNRRLVKAVTTNNFTDPMFNIGRYDGGKGVGGIFWYRPGESVAQYTMLPFKQYAGHTPTITRGGMSWAVQDRNGITYVDTARWWDTPLKDKVINFYADTSTTKAVRTGEVLAKPGEGSYITLPLQENTKPQVESVIAEVKNRLGTDFEALPLNEVGLTVKVPENIDTLTLEKFVDDLSNSMKRSVGTLDYGLVGGYPNTYHPSHVYLGLKNDSSLAYLIDLQNEVNRIGKSLGYKVGDFKVQAGMTLGKVSGNKVASQKLLEAMRHQSDDVVRTDIRGYQKPDVVRNIDSDTVAKTEEAKVVDDNLNVVARAEESYPPTVPTEERLPFDEDMGQIALNRKWNPFATVSPYAARGIEDASLAYDAKIAVEEMPVKPDDVVYQMAEKADIPEEALSDEEIPALGEVPDYYKMTTEERPIGEEPESYYESSVSYGSPEYKPPSYAPSGYAATPYAPSGDVPPVPTYNVVPEPLPTPDTVLTPTPSPTIMRDERAYQEQVAKIQPGTVVWLQGRPTSSGGGTAGMYKILPPPYRQEDLFTMRDSPPGYSDEGWAGKGMARQSLQVIGGDLAENVENVDLGWARINIRMEGGKPEISYIQDEEANVGERSQTIGMGEGQIPIEEWKAAKKEGVDLRKGKQGGMLFGEPLLQESDLLVNPEQKLLSSTEEFGEMTPSALEVEPSPELGVTEKPSGLLLSDEELLVSREDLLLPGDAELLGGKNRLVESGMVAEVSEGGESGGDFPRKKPKRLKNWWDSPPYSNSRSTTSKIPERTYFGHRLLPPDLGGSL